MDDKIREVIKKKFDSLPESIQEIILSSHYENTLIEIGRQYNLTVEQMGVLERETTMVMMGLIPTDGFEVELTRELGVDKLKGSQIVKDIEEKITLKIRELLKLMNTPAGEEPLVEEEKEEESNAPKKVVPKQTLPDNNQELESREKILEKIENPEPVVPHPILAQKLAGSMKIESAKTEHTLENLSKPTGEKNAPSLPAQAAPANKYSVDPYREIPE